MARDTSLRETKQWRLMVVWSGEVAMETKVAEDRRQKLRAGQAVRMLDILADRGKGFGVFAARDLSRRWKFADACKDGGENELRYRGAQSSCGGWSLWASNRR